MRRLLALLVLAPALVACGEDALSSEEYRSELRKLCVEADELTEKVQQPTRATPAAIADYLRRLRNVNVRTIERVEELEPPEELADAHNSALAANRAGRARLEKVIRDLEQGGDPTQVLAEAKSELTDASRRAQQAAKAVGVPECAN